METFLNRQRDARLFLYPGCNEYLWIRDALKAVGIVDQERRVKQEALSAIIVALMNAPRPVSYSRRRNSYTRYDSSLYSYTNIVPNMDLLESFGLIHNEIAVSGYATGRQSRCWLTEDALALFAQFEVCAVPGEFIIVRDKDGIPKSLGKSTEFRRLSRQMEHLREARAELETEGIEFAAEGYRQFGTVWRQEDNSHQFNTANIALCRVFNKSLRFGGRIYRDYIQEIRKAMRGSILIGGEPTWEPNFHAIHIVFCYADIGKALHGDPYDLAGVDRPVAKVALNALLCAETPIAAQRAIAKKLSGDDRYWRAGEIIEELEWKHSSIAHMFGTGVGLKYQARDSKMAVKVLTGSAKKGVMALGLHDGFRCKRSEVHVVEEQMDRALKEDTQGLAGHYFLQDRLPVVLN